MASNARIAACYATRFGRTSPTSASALPGRTTRPLPGVSGWRHGTAAEPGTTARPAQNMPQDGGGPSARTTNGPVRGGRTGPFVVRRHHPLWRRRAATCSSPGPPPACARPLDVEPTYRAPRSHVRRSSPVAAETRGAGVTDVPPRSSAATATRTPWPAPPPQRNHPVDGRHDPRSLSASTAGPSHPVDGRTPAAGPSSGFRSGQRRAGHTGTSAPARLRRPASGGGAFPLERSCTHVPCWDLIAACRSSPIVEFCAFPVSGRRCC